MSGPLTITFRKAKAAGACEYSYRTMIAHVGTISAYGRDTPMPIETVLDVCGTRDAIWAMQAIGARREIVLWSADCAERVLAIYERKFPDDKRPRRAIEVARENRPAANVAYAAGAAANAALAANAANAAANAAYYAASDAYAAANVAYAAGAAAYAAYAAAACAAAYAADAAALAAYAADAAAYAAYAAAARSKEIRWQETRLRRYLRGHL